MPAASLVASAIGIVLLLVTAYVLVGGLVQTTEIVTSAQKDMTARSVNILETNLSDIRIDFPQDSPDTPYIKVTNSGTKDIPVEYIDLYLATSSEKTCYTYNTWKDWRSESSGEGVTIYDIAGVPHPITSHHVLDSGETLSIPCGECLGKISIQATTGNGRSIVTVFPTPIAIPTTSPTPTPTETP